MKRGPAGAHLWATMAIGALVVAACSVAAVQLTGHPCPCVSGWTCDPMSNQCVEVQRTDAASNPGSDAGVTESSSGDASTSCPCPMGYACSPDTHTCQRGAVGLDTLTASYTTPYSIHWTWPTPKNLQLLSYFELVVGPSQNDVLIRSAASTVWTSHQNPELGFGMIQHSNSTDPVTRTITDELAPATTYWAQLVAVDNSGLRSGSSAASGTTLSCPEGIVPLVQSSFSGWVLPCATQVPCSQTPPSLTFAADAGAACANDMALVGMDTCLVELAAQCDVGVTGAGCDAGCGWCPACAGASPYCLNSIGCDDVLHVAGLGAALTGLTSKAFETAYVEFAFEADATATGNWSEVQLQLANRSDYWTYLPWTVRADKHFRVVQLPLRAMVHNTDGTTMTVADLSPDGGPPANLDEFRIYSTWLATIRIAGIALKW